MSRVSVRLVMVGAALLFNVTRRKLRPDQTDSYLILI